MKDYKKNQGLDIQTLQQSLNWSKPERTNQAVRKRVEEIKQEHTVKCVWSNKKLNQNMI